MLGESIREPVSSTGPDLTTILVIHAACTLAMAGVIWFVQLVHYPLFARVANGDFAAFACDHQRRTAWVVAPLMLGEASAATWLLFAWSGRIAVWIGWLLLLSIWLSTALYQVPLHRRLAIGFDRRAVRQLISTNWWRTAAWTARAAIALELLTEGGSV